MHWFDDWKHIIHQQVKRSWDAIDKLPPRAGKQEAKRQVLWLWLKDRGRWSRAMVEEVTELSQKEH